MYGKRPGPRSRDASLDLVPRQHQVREASPHPLQTCLCSHDQIWAPRDRAMATQSSRRSWGWIRRNRVRLIPGYNWPSDLQGLLTASGSCTLSAHPLIQKVTCVSAPLPVEPLRISSPQHCFLPPTKYWPRLWSGPVAARVSFRPSSTSYIPSRTGATWEDVPWNDLGIFLTNKGLKQIKQQCGSVPFREYFHNATNNYRWYPAWFVFEAGISNF